MRYTYILCVSAAACLSWPAVRSAPASADLGDQLFKLLPNDAAWGDQFGTSVAINGTTAIVGANWDDDNGSASGSAYLFDTTTGRQIAKLLPDDGAEFDHFGGSVAIDGTTAIVAALQDDDNGSQSGSSYLFDTTTGQQLFKLLPSDGAAGNLFGISVAISGTTAIVGAQGDDNGPAYLFDTITGRQIAKLLPDDGAAGDAFGISVAIRGTTAIVGAEGDNDNGVFSGSAYLFDTITGRQFAKLLPNHGAALDLFGHSVAINGPTAIVGAVLDDDNGLDSGSAYLFDVATGRQIAKLLPDDGAAGDQFGRSVGISGTIAIVGARRDDDNGFYSGSAYLFDVATGRQIAKLLANDGAAGDLFGSSVAISGAAGNETAIVGANEDDDACPVNPFCDSGSAYLFDAAGTPETCPWDLDDNEVVGVSDLLSLLGSWGPCPPKADCPADFDGNGNVGVSDLLALLAHWGPCP